MICAICKSPRHSTEGHDRLERAFLTDSSATACRIALVTIFGHEYSVPMVELAHGGIRLEIPGPMPDDALVERHRNDLEGLKRAHQRGRLHITV